MTDDILDRIGGWCTEEHDLELSNGEIIVQGDPPLHIHLVVEDERVLLSHTFESEDPSGGFADAARRLLTRRGSMVRGTVEAADESVTTMVEYPIYRDGINRQAFLLAVRDVAGTVDSLGEAGRSLAGATAPAQEDPEETPVEAAEEPVGDEPETAKPLADLEAPVSVPEPTEELDAPAPAVIDDPWAPTHTVPGGGMDAWTDPDPSLSPVANLQARVELRVDEMRGAWARVTGSNGWTGWVDGRRLMALGGGAPTGPAAGPDQTGFSGFGVFKAGSLTVRLVPFLGGIALVVSIFLDWLQGTGLKSLDWPLAVLWRQGSPDHPRLGLILLVLGLLAVLLSFVPRVPTVLFVFLGTAAAACPIIYFIQAAASSGVTVSDAFDAVGPGFWTAFAGGIITNIAGRMNAAPTG
jgi:hypothetical protein